MRLGIVAALLCMLIGACEKADQNKLKDAAKKVGREATDAAIDLAEHLMPVPEDPPANEGKLLTKEVSLGPLPKDVSPQDIEISPDQRHVAFVVKRGDKSVVLADGKEGRAYDKINAPHFSPDSKRLLYSAARDGKQFVVVNGVEGKGYDPWDDTYPIASPDARRVAFKARRDGKTFMVTDGVEGKPYRKLDTQNPWRTFSPDSKRFAYAAQRADGKWVMVIDGVEGKAYDSIGEAEFSRDSQRVSYEATKDGVSVVVIAGREVPAAGGFWGQFSPDGMRFAYIMMPDTNVKYVVVDGKREQIYEDIEGSSLGFSPDSKHLAYVAKNGEKQCVVMDGIAGPWHDGVKWFPTFSPDSKHMAYVGEVDNATKSLGPLKVKDGFMVLDAKAGPTYWYVNRPIFTPDSKSLAYSANKGKTWTVVRDGKEGPEHRIGEAWRAKIVFSPDYRRMGYWASQARQVDFVVVDGVSSPRYKVVDPDSPVFSPDSKHVAYWAYPNYRYGWRIFVDGSYSDKYGEPLYGSKLTFDGPDTLHALAVKDGGIFRVEIKIQS